MRWFDDVFLKRLFERAGADNELWLTARQTAICCRYMDEHIVQMRYGKHSNFSYKWKNRNVSLSYSKKNGCGVITFGVTPEEGKAFYEAYQAERKKWEREQLARMKHERLIARIEKARKEIEDLTETLEMDKEDLQEAVEGSQEKRNLEWSIEVTERKIEGCKEKLFELEEAMKQVST